MGSSTASHVVTFIFFSYMLQLYCHSLLVAVAEGVCLEGLSSAGGFVQAWVDVRQNLLEQELLDVNCRS